MTRFSTAPSVSARWRWGWASDGELWGAWQRWGWYSEVMIWVIYIYIYTVYIYIWYMIYDYIILYIYIHIHVWLIFGGFMRFPKMWRYSLNHPRIQEFDHFGWKLIVTWGSPILRNFHMTIYWNYAKVDLGSRYPSRWCEIVLVFINIQRQIRQHSWGLASLLISVHRHGILPFYRFRDGYHDKTGLPTSR